MPGNSTNPTTIWTPQQGWLNGGNAAPYTGAGPVANQPYYVDSTDENGNPIQVLSPQSGQAQSTQFTGANGLTTTGVMNPYGFSQDNAGLGYYGANPNVTPQGSPIGDINPAPTSPAPSYAPASAPLPQPPANSTPAPASPAPAPSAPQRAPGSAPSPYLSGVSSNYIDPNTQQPGGSSPTNPYEFATPAQAQALAQRLGGTAQGMQLGGPDSFSQPQQMITFPGASGGINVGLATQTLGNYGSASNSYGAYELARDKASLTNPAGAQSFPDYASWYAQQGGGSAGAPGGTAPAGGQPTQGGATGGYGTYPGAVSGGNQGGGPTGGGTGQPRQPTLPPVYVNPAPHGVASAIPQPASRNLSLYGGATTTQIDPTTGLPFATGSYVGDSGSGGIDPNTGLPLSSGGGGGAIDPNTGLPMDPNSAPSGLNQWSQTPVAYGQNLFGGVTPMYGGQPSTQSAYTPTGENLQYKAENDRALAIGQGAALQNQFGAYTSGQGLRAQDYENQLAQAYSGLGTNPAYTQDEQNSILNQPALNALQLSPDQQAQNYLSPDEQAAISGNPYQGVDTFNAGAANQNSAFGTNVAWQQQADIANGQAANTALANSAQGVRGATNNWQNQAADYLGQQSGNVRNAFDTGATNINNSLQYGSGLVQGGIDPSQMRVSQNYLQNEQFGPQDQQNIIEQAGQNVQSQEQADQDQLMRQAQSQGNTTPLALAAMQNRLRQTGEINSANAMTNAAIQAKQLGLQTTQTAESTRLGAEQGLEGLQTNANLNLAGQDLSAQQGLSQQNVGAEEYLGSSALGTANTLGAAQQGAEQYVGNQALQSQQFQQSQSNASLANLQAQNLQNQQNITAGSTAAVTGAEQTASQRAQAEAQNRQTISQANQQNSYNRGMNIYQAGSAANLQFANARLQQGQEQRGYLTGQQQQASQNVGVGQQQQLGAYGTQTGATNASTANAINNYAIPGLWKQVVGSLEKGGVVAHGPKRVLMGEGYKPELLVNLDEVDRADEGNGPYVPDQSETASMGQPLAANAGSAPTTIQNNPAIQNNPFWLRIIQGIRNARYGQPVGNQAQQAAQQPQNGSGLLNAGLAAASGIGKIAGLIAARGIVAVPHPANIGAGMPNAAHHFYGARRPGIGIGSGVGMPKVAPGVRLIDHPQIHTLGSVHPQAVIPLTPRATNKVTPQMIPGLARRFGNYGRPGTGAQIAQTV